jgi:hypothetical protein
MKISCVTVIDAAGGRGYALEAAEGKEVISFE